MPQCFISVNLAGGGQIMRFHRRNKLIRSDLFSIAALWRYVVHNGSVASKPLTRRDSIVASEHSGWKVEIDVLVFSAGHGCYSQAKS